MSGSQYLRFVTDYAVEGSDAREGIFRAAYEIRERESRPEYASEYLEDLLSWFRSNLTIPPSFSCSKKSGRQVDHTRGLSWFKAEATAELAKIEELAAFVGQYGYFIERLTTDRPGYIIYEDDVQIVADPFSDTPR